MFNINCDEGNADQDYNDVFIFIQLAKIKKADNTSC